jgi:penicillin-binding protein 1C
MIPMEEDAIKSKTSCAPRVRRSSWKRRARIVTTVVTVPILTAVISFRAAVAWMPYSSTVVTVPQRCTWIEDRNGESLGAFVPASDQWNLPLDRSQISSHLLSAIVAIEDRRFYAHHGVDWRSVGGAIWQDAFGLSEHRGASTLTMQLYRLSHPEPRSIWAKLMQAVRAEQIEQRLSKQQILVGYLNAAPFGGNLVGAGAASWRYFDRPCKDLSLSEAALLAGLPQNPNELRPDRFPQRALARRNKVLNDMLASGLIDQT